MSPTRRCKSELAIPDPANGPLIAPLRRQTLKKTRQINLSAQGQISDPMKLDKFHPYQYPFGTQLDSQHVWRTIYCY